MYQKNCVICGEEFQAKRPEAKYCSEKCRTRNETIAAAAKKRERALNKLKSKECSVCLKEFMPHIRNPYQIYCGQECLDKAMYERRKEQEGFHEQKRIYDKDYRAKNADKKRENDLKYKDNLRFDGNGSKAMERDGYKCTECGKSNRRALIVHHKDHSGSSDKPNNDLSNLVTLCRSCHMKHHASEDNHVLKYRIDNEIVKRAVESSSTYTEAAEKLGVSRTWVARTSKKFNFARTVK